MFQDHGRRAGQHLIVPVLIASFALTVAACGGAGTSTNSPVGGGASTSTSSPAGGGGTPPAGAGSTGATLPPGAATPHFLTFNLDLTGAVALSGSISKSFPMDTPCSAITLTDIGFSDTVGGHLVGLQVGAFDPSKATGTIPLDTSSYVSIDTGEDLIFSPTSNGATTIQVNTDGTGRLAFDKWTSATGKTESGTITWTCG